MKCPECGSKKVEVYENSGKEWICKDCGTQWQLFEDGGILVL